MGQGDVLGQGWGDTGSDTQWLSWDKILEAFPSPQGENTTAHSPKSRL